MSVQTLHFFRPPLPKVYRPTFWDSKTKVSRSTTFIAQQQKYPVIEVCYVTNDTFAYVLWSTDYS